MNRNVTISEQARELAERRAREQGFETVDEYVDALIQEDNEQSAVRDWMKRRIEEGLGSPNAGELTRRKFDDLVTAGIALAKSKK